MALTGRLAMLSLLLLTACRGSGELPPSAVEGTSIEVTSAPCVPVAVLDAASVPPPPVPFPAGAELTGATQLAGQRLVSGRVAASVEQVLAHFQAAARPSGYVVQRSEDEGRTGRLLLFGARGEVTITIAQLHCPRGQTGFTVGTAAP